MRIFDKAPMPVFDTNYGCKVAAPFWRYSILGPVHFRARLTSQLSWKFCTGRAETSLACLR